MPLLIEGREKGFNVDEIIIHTVQYHQYKAILSFLTTDLKKKVYKISFFPKTF
jgi:hypothetical protein